MEKASAVPTSPATSLRYGQQRSAKCAEQREASLVEKAFRFEKRVFGVRARCFAVACLTEKILNARQHLLRHRKDQAKKRVLSIWISRRHRVMKYLYRTDYDLYKLTCKTLRKNEPPPRL